MNKQKSPNLISRKAEVNLVTGGAGFLGSHLIEKLIKKGEKVICLDNFITGREKNISQWEGHPNFKLINHNLINPIELNVQKIWHLACPASPKIFCEYSIETSQTNYLGTLNMLELSKKNKATFLMASSSAVYGDPEIHPQIETYKGSVNSFGNRSCYEEGKRIAESLCFDYKNHYKCDIRIARIFNTYGPKMNPNDGRVISNFIVQALKDESITIYGDGEQTRSFCYVDDLINGLNALMNSNYQKPINIGNEFELSIKELAYKIKSKINPNISINNLMASKDDPKRRRPCIAKARRNIKWEPYINLDKGLEKTISYFREELNIN